MAKKTHKKKKAIKSLILPMTSLLKAFEEKTMKEMKRRGLDGFQAVIYRINGCFIRRALGVLLGKKEMEEIMQLHFQREFNVS